MAYGTKTYLFRPDVPGEDEDEDQSEESVDLQRGENLVELQIVGATLTPSILETMGDGEPSTFCTYSFYLFELHSTPVVTGAEPRYGFTSRYVVNVDEGFLDYVSRSSVTVELHQALGLDWRTLGTGQLRLQQLLEHDGKIQGSVPLVGESLRLGLEPELRLSLVHGLSGLVWSCVRPQDRQTVPRPWAQWSSG